MCSSWVLISSYKENQEFAVLICYLFVCFLTFFTSVNTSQSLLPISDKIEAFQKYSGMRVTGSKLSDSTRINTCSNSS